MKAQILLSTLVAAVFLFPFSQARAGWEFEADPIAFASKGYSGHAIFDTDYGFRFDVGAFGMQVPEFAQPTTGFKSRLNGYGAKVDYYGQHQAGIFIGLQYNANSYRIEQRETGIEKSASLESAGVRVGYRFGADGWYISPWIGVDRVFLQKTLEFPGKEYKFPAFVVFPTVHIGYRF